jgi:hypothetical protein
MEPDRARRYKARTQVERFFAWLKDESGGLEGDPDSGRDRKKSFQQGLQNRLFGFCKTIIFHKFCRK